MPDFGARRDLTATTAFTDPLSVFTFGFPASQQGVANESDATMELSWDGINVHAVIPPSGPSSAISWDDHSRERVFIRRVGAGGGAKLFTVLASTR